MSRLLHSAKFWMVVFDMVVSLTMYFVAVYVPGASEHVKFFIGAIQPVFVMMIAAIFGEDAAAKKAGIDPNPSKNG